MIIQLKNDILIEHLYGIDIIKRDSSLYDLESAVWGIKLGLRILCKDNSLDERNKYLETAAESLLSSKTVLDIW